jgi:3-hydroxyacyl-[acyl-carrier-protein] dehydratase
MPHNTEFELPANVIPHRDPHLWLDGITALNPGVSAEGFWLPGDEHYVGHFDGMPLLQGVKQVESLAQLGAYTVMVGNEQPMLGIFKGIEDTSFERSVRPGETLDLSIEIVDKAKRDFKGRGIARVGGIVTCQTTIIGTLLPEKVAHRLLGKG